MKHIGKMMAGAAMMSAATIGTAQGEDVFLKMDSFPAGSTAGQFGIVFSQMVQKYTPYKVQVSIGKPATKSAISAAKKQVDLFLTAAVINHFMQKKAAMFKKVKDADKMNANLRNIINYPLGPYHIVVYEDSGIKTLADIKGKKVFLGPPAGAATRTTTAIVAGATGYKPGEDFEIMRFDWKTAETAFIDRQMDVFMVPTTVPSPTIQQFALVSKIRFIGLDQKAWDSKQVQGIMKLPGRTREVIPAGIYTNQANETDVDSMGGWVGIGAHKWLPEEQVYNMTKAFWDHLDEVHATAEWMKVITKDTVFSEVNIPLHIGAYKYYKENGYNIPDHLIPPEAK